MGIAAACRVARDRGIQPYGLAANPARVRLVAIDQGIFDAGEVPEPVVPAPVPLVLELPDVEPLVLLLESVLLRVLPVPMPVPVVPLPEPGRDPDMPLAPMLDDDVSVGDVIEPLVDEPMLPVVDEPMLPVVDESMLPVVDESMLPVVDESMPPLLDVDGVVLPVEDVFGVTVVVADGVVIVVVAGADVVVVVVVVVESDERP
jgi:signal-induced proliferation-associated 1 like protein 3